MGSVEHANEISGQRQGKVCPAQTLSVEKVERKIKRLERKELGA